MNSGFWKAKSGKMSLAERTAHSKSVQGYTFVRKVHLGMLSPLKSLCVVRTLLTKKWLNIAFQWNFKLVLLYFFFFYQTFLIQTLRWFLSLNLLLGQIGKWYSFVPKKLTSLLMGGKDLYASEHQRRTENLH